MSALTAPCGVANERLDRNNLPMKRSVLPITVYFAVSVILLLSGSGCGGTYATSPHAQATARASAPSTRLAQQTAPLSVYIGSTEGAVTALNAASGVLRWRSVVAGSASTTTIAGLSDGAVYVSAINVNQQPLTTELAALRLHDGTILWHTSVAGTASVVATGSGVVYLALDGDGRTPHELQMVRAQDGAVLWHTQVAGAGPLRASVHEGTIYVTSFTSLLPSPGYYYASTNVYALSAGTGAVSWHVALGRTNYLAAVADGAVYLVDTGTDVVCEPNALHVLSASDGVERWHSEGTLLRLIGVEQGRAYVAIVPEGCAALSYDHSELSARNAGDGSLVWQIDVPSAYSGPLTNGVIYLPGAGGILAAYRAMDGARLWRVQGESGQVWVLDQGLYTSVAGQGLDALDSTTGAVRWRYRPGDDVALATITNGILYGISSRQILGSTRQQAIVALTTRDGKLLWTFPIGASEDTPLVG
jgi:outer membrane protein assembly factor BamB